MMTRKDFEAIAHVLDANHADIGIVLDFAMMLEEQNPRFDTGLFVKAATHHLLKDIASTERIVKRAITGRKNA
jgi:hypothetical protein